jgi:type IV secretory pathway VirB2 component (pilin)
MITRRRVTIAAALVALAVIVFLTPRTEDPDSTMALRRYLQNIGHAVS